MSDDSAASLNDSENQVSRKVIKEDFWPKKNKAENPFGGDIQKNWGNHHISYLWAETECPREIVAVDGCNNDPVYNDGTLLQFRDFDAVDGDASQINLKSIGGHMLQITALASMRTIDAIFYAPTAWCIQLKKNWPR